jgi:pimeloyl-ACP methyl ester carboxylesterase
MNAPFGKRRSKSLPLQFRLLRAALKGSAVLSSELAGRWVNYLWFRTQRFPEPRREAKWLESAQRSTVSHRGGQLAVYSWGEGPAVVLMHGWHGRGPQLGAFAAPLVAAGYRVTAFDAPAHGRSPGKATNLPEVTEALLEVADTHPSLHGVIAHSFGTLAMLYAISQGLTPRRAVAVSAPASVEFLMQSFAATLDVSAPVMAVHRRLMEARFGTDLWQRFSPTAIAASLSIPALVVHDDTDHEIPWNEGAAVAQAWPGAQFVQTHGLGHRRILHNPDVVSRVCGFLTAGTERPPR